MPTTEIALSTTFGFQPTEIIPAEQRVPIENDYIPLLVFSRKFQVVTPALKGLADGAIAMSLGFPFGFMRHGIETQKTNQIILASDLNMADKWCARLETDNPLTPEDIDIIRHGMGFYATRAAQKLGLI